MKITFYGAVETVTGSKHLLTLKNGKQILLDCGMFQGKGKDTDHMNRHFAFSVASIDYLVLSHAHIDHSGNIPLLVKRGFKGKIFCTPATLDLCKIMLADSAHIQQSDADFINKRRLREGKSEISPLYTLEDVENCWKYFETLPYKKWKTIEEGIKLCFTDAGHILGAGVVNLRIKEGKKEKKICFTGDVGRYINKILERPKPFPQADTIICESTYGDRLHGSLQEAKEMLLLAVRETCLMKKGKLIIPAFSIGKTQELIYELNKMEFNGDLPKVKVFVDSPLAINATEIIKDHKDSFSPSILKFMEKDTDPFGFNDLYYVRGAEDSKAINNLEEPCIIISASGMAEAGRVKHHLANTIADPKNAVLIIGYSEPSSLAGKLLRGDKQVSIYGNMYGVEATIYSIDFFSAHADYNELVQFLGCQDKALIDQMFLVHGNKLALSSFKDTLYKKGYYNVTIPQYKESYDI